MSNQTLMIGWHLSQNAVIQNNRFQEILVSLRMELMTSLASNFDKTTFLVVAVQQCFDARILSSLFFLHG